MARHFGIALLALCVLGVGSRTVANAHEGHDHKILGTVTMAAPDHVMLKDTDGKNQTVSVTKDTKVLKDKTAMTVVDIKTGMRVVITAVTETEKGKETMVAKTIELGQAPATK
jgi:uncharacterized protein YndB with AHSA1/START domain